MRVQISASVNLILQSLANTTEQEESACLLLGSLTPDETRITNIFLTTFKDKRKDRIEISAEQLSLAITKADSLDLQVVGWMY